MAWRRCVGYWRRWYRLQGSMYSQSPTSEQQSARQVAGRHSAPGDRHREWDGSIDGPGRPDRELWWCAAPRTDRVYLARREWPVDWRQSAASWPGVAQWRLADRRACGPAITNRALYRLVPG